MDILAFKQAQYEEKWSWKLKVILNLLKPVKPALDLPYLEHVAFKAPHIILFLDDLVLEIQGTSQFSLLGQDQATMAILIKPYIELSFILNCYSNLCSFICL